MIYYCSLKIEEEFKGSEWGWKARRDLLVAGTGEMVVQPRSCDTKQEDRNWNRIWHCLINCDIVKQ